ncbi:hypothetical protein AAZX31_07G149400 [Glycine max]|nr:hypothetical protein JHK87_018633 [Glycine soja]KAG5022833.1 hypothetical protein JHK85_019175 [Glycine max]KAG5037916.1 hypothetical protein JHK86_018756 [Glycine max]KAG5143038.1 hypothetical protein JHK82_018733 [Glycine max]
MRAPLKAPTPPMVDKQKHYHFHQNYDHTTEECTTLKDKIKDLIRDGHLKDFLHKPPATKNSYDHRRNHVRTIEGKIPNVVDMIEEMTIVIQDDDFKGLDPMQEDLMVITMEVDNCMVMKTLINQGSSVDILYWPTFQKLEIPEAEIKPYDDQPIGFSGKG